MMLHGRNAVRSGALSWGRCADILTPRKPGGRELGLANDGYTYFGYVFDRLLRSRGYNQSTFASECRRVGLRLRGPFKEREIGQRSVSDWMRGRTACPREVPIYADSVLNLSEEEWAEFGLAYAYGQTASKEEFEDLFEFRKFYRARLPEGSPDESAG
jgi:hypothetical protein